MRSLPLFHVIAGRTVLVVGDGAAAEARRRLVERAGGVVATDLEAMPPDASRLAFVASEDRDCGEAAAVRLRGAGLLVNVADRPELCDFTVPAIVDREPVIVAVGTGGASAGLAKWLRLRFEALLPQDLGRLAQALAEARKTLRGRWPDPAERRRGLDGALAPGGELDPLQPGAADRIPGWLATGTAAREPETVEISIRSDDPEDLTLREARVLGCADLVLYEAAVAPAVLDRARADAVRRPLGEVAAVAGLTVILRRER